MPLTPNPSTARGEGEEEERAPWNLSPLSPRGRGAGGEGHHTLDFQNRARSSSYGRIVTSEPTFSMSKISVTSSFRMRMQPRDSDLPIEAGSIVP